MDSASLRSAVSTGMPSESRGTGGAEGAPPTSEIAATPVRPWNSIPATVSLRIGAVLSSITSATILRGLSSLIDRIWPAGTPSKLTGPPRRSPLAEPPSNTTRNWLRL
ncbi:hypothetical protein AC629_28145 [Bradyrhizobium sp. NAS80.1]|nr:hypothetical protein AC629_28145 [Bradyrhizobium sp. NAS80.1]